MKTLVERCAGIDVGKRFVMVCVLTGGPGEKAQSEVRKYGTTTLELESLRQWLTETGCTQAVMESTGTYWKPLLNVLESGLSILLANARHVKNVPGRKSDVSDCQWLAQLLRHGLIRGSFIPPRDIRNLRISPAAGDNSSAQPQPRKTGSRRSWKTQTSNSARCWAMCLVPPDARC